MQIRHQRKNICKNTNILECNYMDGFCLQGELDLTLFYKTEGYWGAIVGYFKTEILNDRK